MPISHRRASVARWATSVLVSTVVLSAGVTAIYRTLIGNDTAAIQIHAPNVAGSATGVLVWEATSSGSTTQSGSATVRGTISGAALSVSALQSCDTIDSNAAGVLSCGTDDGAGALTYADAQSYFVDDGGDTMTGSLTVHGTVSGSILSGKTLEVQQVNPTYLPFQITLSGTALAVSSGTVAFTVPPALNGFNICDAVYQTDNAGITGTTDLQLYNITDGTHVYSVPFSIDSLENTTATAATPGTINTANDDVNTDEVLLFGVAEIHSGTAAQGLKGYLKFCLP